MSTEPLTTADYISADPAPTPSKRRNYRRYIALAASIVAVCVGVVCVVALVATSSSSNEDNNGSMQRSVSRCAGSTCSTDRPGGTPFVHEPNCPILAYCRDNHLNSDVPTKLRSLMQKVREDTESGPEAGVGDLIGIVDPEGIVDPNSWWSFIGEFFAAAFTGILNAFSKGMDVRTTFGVGLDWQQLKHAYTTGDQMEPGRGKAIHAVGVVGSVTFDASSAEPHPFTGLLKEGFDGIVRLSSAVPIARGKTQRRYIVAGPKDIKKPFVVAPGMGLKALVKGHESADLVSMWHLDGQPGEWNFFAHEFSTVVPGSTQTALKLVGKHFEDASKCPSHVSLLGFAEVTRDGRAVAKPQTPYAIVFVPDPALKRAFDGLVRDGRLPSDVHACEEEEECPDVLDTLASIRAGQNLYTLYAIANPSVQPWVGEAGRFETFDRSRAPSGVYRLGVLRLTSVLGKALDRSKFGDTDLFFRHRLFEDGVLNALCLHNDNWIPHMRVSADLLSRNLPTCSIGGDDYDGSDTEFRKQLVCRLLFRAQAIFPTCFDRVVDTWNSGGFFPFSRRFDQLNDRSKWLAWCGKDNRPTDNAARGMVEQSFS